MNHLPHRIAINGYGRIGRSFLRALIEAGLQEKIEVVHINEPADLDSIAYLTRFDSTHGRFPGSVARHDLGLLINNSPISVSHAKSPQKVDWASLDIQLLVECSGQFGQRGELETFLNSGVKRLLLSHPGQSTTDVDATIVYGVNHNLLSGSERLVSSASCTTNAVVPILDLLDREYGIEQVFLNTLHSVMNDQPLIDGYHHSDLRRTRSAMQSIIPVSTGLARGVERVLPRLTGRVQAKAIRVPTLNVSAIDLVLHMKKSTSKAAVNKLLADASASQWAKLIAYTEDPHASIDFNHDMHSAIVDGSQTLAAGDRFINLMVWFDNEWGYVNRMIDVATHWLTLSEC